MEAWTIQGYRPQAWPCLAVIAACIRLSSSPGHGLVAAGAAGSALVESAGGKVLLVPTPAWRRWPLVKRAARHLPVFSATSHELPALTSNPSITDATAPPRS